MRSPNNGRSYQSRAESLRILGFSSYEEYLRSELWFRVRAKVFEMKGTYCHLCGNPATALHHNRYHVADLLGKKTKFIIPICHLCHYRIEFDRGEKNKLARAAQKCKAFRRIQQNKTAEHSIPDIAGYIVARKSVVHIWEGRDTACRMASEGELKLTKYSWSVHKQHERVCQKCLSFQSREQEAHLRKDLPEPDGWIVGERFHELRAKFPPIPGIPPWEGEDCLVDCR